jgi:hypothetical protein
MKKSKPGMFGKYNSISTSNITKEDNHFEKAVCDRIKHLKTINDFEGIEKILKHIRESEIR